MEANYHSSSIVKFATASPNEEDEMINSRVKIEVL